MYTTCTTRYRQSLLSSSRCYYCYTLLVYIIEMLVRKKGLIVCGFRRILYVAKHNNDMVGSKKKKKLFYAKRCKRSASKET